MRRSPIVWIIFAGLIGLSATLGAVRAAPTSPTLELPALSPSAVQSGTPQYWPAVYHLWPATLTPTRTQSADQFTLQPGSPGYLGNFANNQGCSWFGVSGQVFNLQGKDSPGLLIHVDGPSSLSIDALTGSAQKYGPSGYEITLGTTPADTTNVYRIQLRNASGQPLSTLIYFNTYGNCQANPRNHIVINFIQNH